MLRLCVLLLLAGTLLADRNKLLQEVKKQLETAYASGDWTLVRSAHWRAKAVRDRYTQKEALVIAETVVRAVDHQSMRIAVAAAELLKELRIEGTTRLLGKKLDPPDEPTLAEQARHLACIEAAAALHEPDGLKLFEKLLHHKNREFAVAGAQALGGYWILDDKPLMALVGRLAKTWEKLLADLAKARESKNKAQIKHYQEVCDALADALRRVTDYKKIEQPADCEKWIKLKRRGDV